MLDRSWLLRTLMSSHRDQSRLHAILLRMPFSASTCICDSGWRCKCWLLPDWEWRFMQLSMQRPFSTGRAFTGWIRRSPWLPERPVARNRSSRATRGNAQKRMRPARERVGDVPVPTEYGAYAVVGGRLIELEQLAIRVPDPRVAISAAFAVPSHSHLPSNPNEFVVFRKDLLNGAPDRAAVRVVAQVARALSFDTSGKPKTSNVEQSWVIRNTAYSMRVGPLPDNPEMIIVRSEQAGLSLPAGRYVLVLKGVGYDFTVDGPVTDPAHCLERTEALNAPIYSECPKP